MTNIIKALIRLTFLFAMWVLVRFTMFCLEVSSLDCECSAVSAAEDHLIIKMQRQLKALTPKFIKA